MIDYLLHNFISYYEGNTNLRSRAVWFSLSPSILHKWTVGGRNKPERTHQKQVIGSALVNYKCVCFFAFLLSWEVNINLRHITAILMAYLCLKRQYSHIFTCYWFSSQQHPTSSTLIRSTDGCKLCNRDFKWALRTCEGGSKKTCKL